MYNVEYVKRGSLVGLTLSLMSVLWWACFSECAVWG